jgi:hypothetical protein
MNNGKEQTMSREEPELWIPMSLPVDIAILGKLGEELGELIAIKDRCLIQGLYGLNPETSELNMLALLEEVADVYSVLDTVVNHFNLNQKAIELRADKKFVHRKKWIEMLEAHCEKKEEKTDIKIELKIVTKTQDLEEKTIDSEEGQ